MVMGPGIMSVAASMSWSWSGPLIAPGKGLPMAVSVLMVVVTFTPLIGGVAPGAETVASVALRSGTQKHIAAVSASPVPPVSVISTR